MNKKISLGSALAFMAIIAALTFSLTMVYSMRSFNKMVYNVREREAMYQKVAEIDRYAREKYLDAIDEKKLMNSVAAGYVAGLGDNYGKYYTAEQYTQYLQSQTGRYVGIGIVPQMDPSGYISVKEVYPDSPAQLAQIMPGDLIVKVDEKDVTTENYEELAASLKGEAGTKIGLVVRSGNDDRAMEITRRQVEVPTVYTRMFEGNVGYVRITSFSDTTKDQFSKLVTRISAEGAASLVIDVRGTAGGSYRAAAGVLDVLLPEGDIVSAQYNNGKLTVLASSDSSEVTLPIAVLTNDKTSGVAEVFAQALKDYNKAKTVGANTAGEGTMQELWKLSDGAAVSITVARYVSPKGVTFDGEGVKPDYEVKYIEGDMTPMVSELDPAQDPQLKKALELAVSSVKVTENKAAEAAQNGSSATK